MAIRICDHRTRRAARTHNVVMRALVDELPTDLRRLRVATLADTLANGVPVDPFALTVVLSALDETCVEPLLITRSQVEELLWIGIERFCGQAGIPTPAGCAPALHAALAYALASDQLVPGSDSTVQLFAPLHEMGFV